MWLETNTINEYPFEFIYCKWFHPPNKFERLAQVGMYTIHIKLLPGIKIWKRSIKGWIGYFKINNPTDSLLFKKKLPPIIGDSFYIIVELFSMLNTLKN